MTNVESVCVCGCISIHIYLHIYQFVYKLMWLNLCISIAFVCVCMCVRQRSFHVPWERPPLRSPYQGRRSARPPPRSAYVFPSFRPSRRSSQTRRTSKTNAIHWKRKGKKKKVSIWELATRSPSPRSPSRTFVLMVTLDSSACHESFTFCVG